MSSSNMRRRRLEGTAMKKIGMQGEHIP